MKYVMLSFDFEVRLILKCIINCAQSVAVFNAIYNDVISTCILLR